ncbi:MAG TPA: S41 family peptidase [Candidatus Eisenbacteria bacterium]|nr:S41 family peptidase [Candidatus Eisenbacteria bacterium]
MIRRRFLIGTAFVVLFGLGWWAGHSSSRTVYADLDLFVDVLTQVQQNYVDPVDSQKIVQGAIHGLVHQLDPFSQYLDAPALANLQTVTTGEFGGIGVLVAEREHFPTVISPIEGTPAWEAGMRAGDVITDIGGKSAEGLSADDVAQRLRGDPGTRVTLTWRREGEDEPHTVTLERRKIEVRPVPYAFLLDQGVGYVRLASFSEQTGAEVRDAVERLRAQGAKSLVLDLRGNPGGLLDQAVDVVSEFVPKGKLVVYTKGRYKPRDQKYYADQARPELGWPMVVLVDEGSASASEIVAGALQDLDRALVVGRTSFGKGSVQDVFPIRGERAALKLTTALYYTPSGRSIHKKANAAPDSADDDEDDDATPAPAPASPKSKPIFHTASGRVVYGGGGITPDVEVPPDTLTGLARAVDSRNLAFRFVNRWLNTHPEARTVPWDPFVAWLREQKVAIAPGEPERQRDTLERLLARELAMRTGGMAAWARVTLGSDPVMAHAEAVLDRARRPGDVFALSRTAPRATLGRREPAYR